MTHPEIQPSPSLVVLQARMGSRRLPGKALSRIGDRTLLGHCLSRLLAAAVAPVVVATTTDPEDAAIVAEAARWGVPAFRGSCDNVLERFVLLARRTGAVRLVRATADNPAVDIGAPARVLAALETLGADHVVEAGLPHGAAVEAVTVRALECALAGTVAPYDREHVTPFVIGRPDTFTVVSPAAPLALRRPDLRLTVDTREDLIYMRDVISVAGGRPAGAAGHDLRALIAAADRVRDLMLQGAA